MKTAKKTVFPWGMFHWGCYFYGGGAKWNHETDGSRRAQARAGMEENQYGNISGCTYQGLTSSRGHRGAATFKWGIQLWNIDLALAMVGIWLQLIGYTVGGEGREQRENTKQQSWTKRVNSWLWWLVGIWLQLNGLRGRMVWLDTKKVDFNKYKSSNTLCDMWVA